MKSGPDWPSPQETGHASAWRVKGDEFPLHLIPRLAKILMRNDATRGRIIYLKQESHARLMPWDSQEKWGRRPFLVVSRDFVGHEKNPYSTIVALTTVPPKSQMRDISQAFLPAGDGLAQQNCWIDARFLFTILESDLANVFRAAYSEKVMSQVDEALRIALALDPDHVLSP